MDADFQSEKQHQQGSDSCAIWSRSVGGWLKSAPIRFQM